MGDAWDPAQYDKFKAERSQPFFDLVQLLQPTQPTTGAKIVDLGCGTGALTAQLHQSLNAAETLGVDASSQMLGQAQTLTQQNLKFIFGDIETWSADAKYDVVFSNAALQWCKDHTRLFARLRNALTDKGQLAVQMPMNFDYPTHTLAHTMSLEQPWADILNGHPYEKLSHMLTVEDYALLLFHLGFTEQKVLLRVYGHILDSPEDVIEWVKGTMLTHFESRMTQSDFARFLVAYRERLLQLIPDERPFFYPFKRIFIWGRLP